MAGSSTGDDCVGRLLDLTGMADRPRETFDWQTIEATLGLPLPEDYKRMAEVFPPGHFNGLAQLGRPGDDAHPRDEFLGFKALRLQDLRGQRAFAQEHDWPGTFPYPIYPEPGGLLPWGYDRRGHQLYWLTEAPDPANWPVVAVPDSYTFTDWRVFHTSTCQFLIDVVEGRIGEDILGPALHDARPFRAIDEPAEIPDAGRAVSFWRTKPCAKNEFDALAEILGPAPSTPPEVDWAGVEQLVGIRLPADYRSFVDQYGAGMFWDLRIAAPHAAGEFDLVELLRRRVVARTTGQEITAGPIYPEHEGVFSWGETSDGWVLGWATVGDDPDLWGTVVARSKGITVLSAALSFSGFLVGLTDPHSEVADLLEREPWSGGRRLFRQAAG